jgi:hypothetical protein
MLLQQVYRGPHKLRRLRNLEEDEDIVVVIAGVPFYRSDNLESVREAGFRDRVLLYKFSTLQVPRWTVWSCPPATE